MAPLTGGTRHHRDLKADEHDIVVTRTLRRREESRESLPISERRSCGAAEYKRSVHRRVFWHSRLFGLFNFHTTSSITIFQSFESSTVPCNLQEPSIAFLNYRSSSTSLNMQYITAFTLGAAGLAMAAPSSQAPNTLERRIAPSVGNFDW